MASLRDGSPGDNDKLCPNTGECNDFAIPEIGIVTPITPVAYAEIAFHSYRPDAEWIRGVDDPAQRLATGIDNYFTS